MLIGRWLLRDPAVLLLDEPTRGIDVAAKFAVYHLIDDLADRGVGVVVVSSEIEELMLLCDRIAVHLGRDVGEGVRPWRVDSREPAGRRVRRLCGSLHARARGPTDDRPGRACSDGRFHLPGHPPGLRGDGCPGHAVGAGWSGDPVWSDEQVFLDQPDVAYHRQPDARSDRRFGGHDPGAGRSGASTCRSVR